MLTVLLELYQISVDFRVIDILEFWVFLFVHSLTHSINSFIHSMFIEHLLCDAASTGIILFHKIGWALHCWGAFHLERCRSLITNEIEHIFIGQFFLPLWNACLFLSSINIFVFFSYLLEIKIWLSSLSYRMDTM